jgi:hypothetical protein
VAAELSAFAVVSAALVVSAAVPLLLPEHPVKRLAAINTESEIANVFFIFFFLSFCYIVL